MKKGKILRKIAMLISLAMLITSTISTTYGYIVTSTDPIVNTLMPQEMQEKGFYITKKIEHPFGASYKIPDNIKFDFKVELGEYYANAEITTTAGFIKADSSGNLYVSLKPGKVVYIDQLTQGSTFKVTEISSLSGFSAKGGATKKVKADSYGTAKAEFVNVYASSAVKGENISVGGVKILEGRDWQEGDSFSFVLEQKNGGGWDKLGEKTVAYDADKADYSKFDFSDIFKDLSFDSVGTYTFRISEVMGNLENVDYDQTVNHFTVKVTDVDMDGALEINTVSATENASVNKNGDGYNVFVTFNNTFIAPVLPDPEPVEIEIAVDKTVNNTGDLTHGIDGFEFVLEDMQTAEKFAAVSDKNGDAFFKLSFTKSDIGNTYVYKLYETNQGAEGITYDETVHEITVSVSLNENNELVTAFTMDGEGADSLRAVFENTYHANKTPAPVTKDNTNMNFWFIMMLVSGISFVSLWVYDRRRVRI